MAIGNVIEKGGFVYVYDEDGHQLCAKGIGDGSGELVGYTSKNFSIKKGGFIYTYDEKGHQKSAKGAK
jgi:phage pi2 protein 07